jgi:hypothetical protein
MIAVDTNVLVRYLVHDDAKRVLTASPACHHSRNRHPLIQDQEAPHESRPTSGLRFRLAPSGAASFPRSLSSAKAGERESNPQGT